MTLTSPSRPHTRWSFAVLFGIAGSLVVAIVVLAFVWPAATATARNLPVGLSGPASQVSALKAAIAKQSTHPFAFVTIDSRAEAVREIRERRLDGAILLGDSPEVLTASAASTASNQALRGVATALQEQISASVEQGLIGKLTQAGTAVAGLQKEVAALQQALRAGEAASGSSASAGSGASAGSSAVSGSGGSSASSGASGSASGGSSTSVIPTVATIDVVPLSSHDSTGAGLAAASFPLVLGGMLGGVLVSFLVVGPMRRIVALLVYGAAAGTTVTLVLQTWLQILQRDWLANAAAFGLAMLATASLVVGFNSLLGSRGIAVGAVISILIGNPISGATLPYQFIAGPWGEVGQFFVSGASANLVRSLSYFPDADVTKQWLVLGVWTVGGLLLVVAGHFRNAAPIALPAAELA